MESISPFDAWQQWFLGYLTPDTIIWGVRLVWWGRLGKIFQFFAAVTILADIVGPERLHQFGKSLHSVIVLEKIRQTFRDCFNWYEVGFHLLFAEKNTAYRTNLLNEKGNYKTQRIFNIVLVIEFIVFLIPAFGVLKEGMISSVCSTYVGIYLFLAPITTFLIIVVPLSIGALVDVLFVEPLAQILENPNLQRIVQITNLTLLLIGFQFDLLAS